MSGAPVAAIGPQNRLQWDSLDSAARANALRRPAQADGAKTAAAVAALIEEVRVGGDAALRRLTSRFDGVDIDTHAVSAEEFAKAQAEIAPALRNAIVEAGARIEQFHAAGMSQPYEVDTAPGVRCERVLRPIQRVGLYVPAGSAPLPSTALMLGIPARLAGCHDVVLCTPPRPDGSVDPAVLVAAASCGIDRVFKLGGVQAIAAMALGTESVPACDKLFGPGNAYVTEAKRQVAQLERGVGIDMPAGPSEVLVIADAGANPEFVAADLLSQAEHGPDSQVILISDDDGLIERVIAQIEAQLVELPRVETTRRALQSARMIQVATLEDAFAISNAYAPEHLILALRDARRWLPSVSVAGSVFLGDWAPEALGDYCSGTNHVLPTSGAARFVGGLNVASFQLAITVQEVDRQGLRAIGPCAVELASAEGLEAHRLAVSRRLDAA
ncbi:histidinol dehydrogenase [Lysobacter ciconiae]|uniref:Histidinol dehydrogenase n=1 Tax=Novilysobacter ciconiae TaxID=2781022 RepID=A0A7S6UHL2_9GAMM|nr:histidinol dehydrogenase [Lysobacter ciconiae]QOW20458.1 histidinol dehydrogenase [Lysobacter ciconiae]